MRTADSDVMVFTKPGCPYCTAAKDDLRKRGIRYAEHNVKADQATLRHMLELNGGQRRVPTIVQGDQVTVGFRGY